ncbi:spermidine/putrescine transport system permease protein [Pseudoxanthobacter soli DSM 19599]|uniref:Spermidine/putrescine transport system permease protein n=1 Tax=Pseudoxanthobacter soli DSM 19599 TaxID=1123029 RepID=A0A1M7ZF01_9HYPH|nr:ABC transporter permease [Pseudoxanthobacter soli]SHO63422.1 spermidine/putrescine transport system permease protein [Pseudoxanthobacter soli DSM 19599]
MRVEPKSWRDPALIGTTVPLALLMVMFFLVPLAMTGVLTFQTTRYYRLVWTWDLTVWREVFGKPSYWIVMLRTVWMAVVCVVLSLLIALPVAYALATRLQSVRRHVTILITFAFLTDAVLKTFGWILVLDRNGVLNWALAHVGFPPQMTNLLFTPTATLIGMVYNLAVYPVFTLYLSLVRIDRDLQLAAYDAGASRIRTFFEITLPLAKPGLYAGAVLVFVLSLGAFLEPKVMGGGTAPLASELIRQSFETRVNWPLGAALTLVLIAIGALSLALSAVVALRRRGTGRP